MRLSLSAVSALAWAALASLTAVANASISYSYVTDTPGLTAPPGATVALNLFLKERVTGADTSTLASQAGLYGAGVKVAWSGTVPSNPATITSIAANMMTSGFAGGSFGSTVAPDGSSVKAAESESNTAATGDQPEDQGGGVMRVLLFTLNLQAGGVAGQTTTFLIDRYGGTGNTLTHSNGYDLDLADDGFAHSAAGPSTFTVTVVPEPASLFLLGAGGMLMLRRTRYG